MRDLLPERFAQPAVDEAHQRQRIVLAAHELGGDAVERHPQAISRPDMHADPATNGNIAVNGAVAVYVLTFGDPEAFADHCSALGFFDPCLAMLAFVPGALLGFDGPQR